MGLLDDIRRGTWVDDGERAGPVPGVRVTIAESAERIRAGEPALHAARDFLDIGQRASGDELVALIADRPELTGDPRADALLAGIAEHLAATRGAPCPRWTREPDRFLDRFWFVSDVPGFRAISLAQSPMALKRRGIMWPARSLERV
jgi:hypothetical protein